MDNGTTVPVLFITFARPEYARPAFNAIKKARPKKLYFYSNKARVDNKDEINRNEEIRNFVKEIDWDCNLKLFFREKHVDIYTSLFSAMDWIFNENDRAIILEEDCVASKAFFNYCEKVLDKYETNKNVWIVSGDNFTPDYYKGDGKIFFSRNGHTYGWAIWKDRWEKVSRKIDNWNENEMREVFYKYYNSRDEAEFHFKRFDKYMKEKYPNSLIWDYLLNLSMILNNGICVVPKYNLVSNIGLTGDHNSGNKFYFNNLETIDDDNYVIPVFPKDIVPDDYYDKNHFEKHWLEITKKSSLFKRLRNKVYRITHLILL